MSDILSQVDTLEAQDKAQARRRYVQIIRRHHAPREGDAMALANCMRTLAIGRDQLERDVRSFDSFTNARRDVETVDAATIKRKKVDVEARIEAHAEEIRQFNECTAARARALETERDAIMGEIHVFESKIKSATDLHRSAGDLVDPWKFNW